MKRVYIKNFRNSVDNRIEDDLDYTVFCMTETIGGTVTRMLNAVELAVLDHNEIESEIEL